MNGKLIAACIIPLILSACSGEGSTQATDKQKEESSNTISAAETGNTVAVVNGKPVSERLFEAYLKQREDALSAGATRQRILDEMINFELVIQDALNNDLDKKPDVVTELELQRRNILATAAFREHVRKNPFTEEDMRKDYESRMADLTMTEFKLRHILTEDENGAQQVLAKLDKGADFVDVAKEYSTGPSASEGGDLGWQAEPDVLPEFRDNLNDLKKGEYAREAIQTRYGWHVLYLEDRRDNPPPTFAEVKEQVREILQRRQIEEYIVELRRNAEVDITKSATVMPTPTPEPLQPNGKPDIMMNNH